MRKVLFMIALAALVPAQAKAQHRLAFGINGGLKWFGYPQAMRHEALRVKAAGATWDREDFSWDSIEPARGRFHWTRMDHLYLAAARRGITILPVVDDTPCWAAPAGTPQGECEQALPARDGDLGAFVAKVVARYGPGGSFWRTHRKLDATRASTHFEILNEPYNAASIANRNPGRYAQLFKAAATAGRRANHRARFLAVATTDVCIAAPCGSGDWVHWADGMAAAVPDIGRYIDGIAIHPYPGPNPPDYWPVNATDPSFKSTDLIRRDFLARGIDKPFWITEVGYSACDDAARCVPGADRDARELQKAAWLGQLLRELGDGSYDYVKAVFVYAFKQPSRPVPDDKEDWFQIISPTGRPLPAYAAYASAAAALSSSRRPRP